MNVVLVYVHLFSGVCSCEDDVFVFFLFDLQENVVKP